ncbi:hypothetical protein [Nocardia sp. NPDC058633]|uniref:hypothetical protein n=1 Tax=Nocardia sp. NPDC058633 TaxID=3346568 RepID=UPI00366718F5
MPLERSTALSRWHPVSEGFYFDVEAGIVITEFVTLSRGSTGVEDSGWLDIPARESMTVRHGFVNYQPHLADRISLHDRTRVVVFDCIRGETWKEFKSDHRTRPMIRCIMTPIWLWWNWTAN